MGGSSDRSDADVSLPNFPTGVPVSRQTFQNWAGDVKIPNVLTCIPRTPEDVVAVCNWGDEHGYKVRPIGMAYNWSPFTLSPDEDTSKILLVNTRQHLTKVESITRSPMPDKESSTITVQAGITMEALLRELQQEGLGLITAPAPGELTLGGVIAVAGHGTAVPPPGGGAPSKGHTYGSLSNAVLSLTAVVWDAQSEKYQLRKFDRSDPECQAFLAPLGRAFITGMTLQAGPNQRLRCKSEIVPVGEVFAADGAAGRTFADYMDRNQGVEAIWYPYSKDVWIKSWSVSPQKPRESRKVNAPFNYIFTDNLPKALSAIVPRVVSAGGRFTPAFGRLCDAVTSVGLSLTRSFDLWGWSKDLLLYIRPETLRVTANGYAVLTNRGNVQRVTSEFIDEYQKRLRDYQKRGLYPVNGPVDIRVTGLDHAREAFDGAREPQLSPLRPRPDHPEWDVAVYLAVVTVPGTEHSNEFYHEIEQWIFANYSGDYAAVRPEWSKGWAYTNERAWQNREMIEKKLPAIFCAGQPENDNFYTAIRTLEKYDPKRLFSSPMLDKLLPKSVGSRSH